MSDLSAGTVTVAVTGGSASISVQQLVAFREERRPATEAEIAELPAFPPSIRERLRREGIVKTVESERVDGDAPIHVERGGALVATLQIEPLPKTARSRVNAGVTRVGFTGAGVDPIEVPVTVLTDRSEMPVTPVPERIVCAARPGEVTRKEVSVWKAPAGTIVAWIDTASASIRLQSLVVQQQVQMWFTEEELAEMPPALREKARRNGYVVFEEMGRAGAGDPVVVPQAAVVSAYVEFAPPSSGAGEQASGTLIIDSSTWRRIEVPLFAVLGNIGVKFNPESLTIRQGERGTIDASIQSIGGPDTDLALKIGFDGDPWTVAPASIHVPRGASMTVPLAIGVGDGAWAGEHRVDIQMLSFGDVDSLTLPVTINVVGGRASAELLPGAVVVRQGEPTSCGVRLRAGGGYKRFTFRAGALPDGVTLNPPRWDISGEGSTIVQLEFVADPSARVTSQPGTVLWSANDGEHGGQFEIAFTVLLLPDSRSFSQPIVTPPGVPLGGLAQFVVNNDGTGRFRGFMEATGAFSYHFGVRAALRSANGRIAMLAQKTGAVYGVFEPGDSRADWDEPITSGFVGDAWSEIRTASFVASKSYELGGALGGAVELLGDVAQFLVGTPLLSAIVPGGAALAAIVLVGSELGGISGLHVVGPGGLVGLTAAGASLFLVGPQALVPVFVAGAAVGSAAVKRRPLRASEMALAREVFHDTLPLERIVLTNLSADKGQEFTAPNIDGGILVNMGPEGFDDALTHTRPKDGYTVGGQILIHELVHAWQLSRGGILVDFFWRALIDRLGGSESYRYGPPGTPWRALSLEAQGSLVDNWFAGTNAKALDTGFARKAKREDDPYFGYIASVIRMGMQP